MGISATIEGGDKLKKYLRKLAKRLGQGGEASIGFFEDATYPPADGGQSVAQVAFWNEFGTERSPPRPFFRNMVEDQSSTWAHKLGTAARWSNYNANQALEVVAADIKGHLVESITLLEDPALAQSTIDRKGFAKPLVETGLMLRSVTWKVTAGAPSRD